MDIFSLILKKKINDVMKDKNLSVGQKLWARFRAMLDDDKNIQATLKSKGLAGSTFRWNVVQETASRSAVLVYLWKRAEFNMRIDNRPRSGVDQANMLNDEREQKDGQAKIENTGDTMLNQRLVDFRIALNS